MKRIVCMIMATIITISSTMITDAEGINYKTCNGFRYNVDGKEINYYVGKKTTATIPAKIEGEKVRDVFLYKAPNLKKLKVSRYVKTIVVARNKKLKKVTIDKKNKYLCVKQKTILNKKKTKMLSALGGYKVITVPDSVEKITVGALENVNLKKIIFGKNVKKMSSSVFGDGYLCKNLKELIFKGNFCPKIEPDTFFFPGKKVLKITVKNEKIAKELYDQLIDKQDFHGKIYVGKKCIYDQVFKYLLNNN